MQASPTAVASAAQAAGVRSGAALNRLVRRIAIDDGVAAAAPAWRHLQAVAPCSPYQRFGWAEAWCATVGAARGERPLVATLYGQGDQPIALFPLVRRTMAGVRVASFIGGKDSNGNLALFADPAAWDAQTLRAALAGIGAEAGVDLFALCNQPETWGGAPTPLRLLSHQPSPSGVAAAGLVPDAPLSKQARKRLRQKTGWLEALGPVELRRAATRAEVDGILAAHVAHRAARAARTGVGGPSRAQLDFYRRAADPLQAGGAVLDLHALRCGAGIVATFGGTGFGDRYSGVILSVDSRPDVARCSPGELLLRRLIADLPARGFTRFDLGIGEARYKASLCDTWEPLFDCFVPVTPTGHVAACGLAAAARLKRRMKQSEPAMTRLRGLAALARRWGRAGLSRP